MLTPTDIHHLVGLLTMASSPDDVDVELGSMIYDVAAEEERDVDITITYPSKSGGTAALSGREVKAHRRPLDVTHIEQLCIKLKDMPSITQRAIVSASGYTRSARLKAAAHGVELFAFCPWDPTAPGWDYLRIPSPDTLRFHERNIDWCTPPNVTLLFSERLRHDENTAAIAGTLRTTSSTGEPSAWGKTTADVTHRILHHAQQLISEDDENKKLADDVVRRQNITVHLMNPPIIEFPSRRLPLLHAIVTGSVKWKTATLPMTLRMLQRDGESTPLVACAVGETGGGDLVGIRFGDDRSLGLVRVSVAARNLEKIRRFRPKSS